MHMHHVVALEEDVLTVLPQVAADGSDQAYRVSLPAHDAYIVIYKSNLGVMYTF